MDDKAPAEDVTALSADAGNVWYAAEILDDSIERYGSCCEVIMGYDTLYQDWLLSKSLQQYAKADSMRIEFERLHGLTIVA